MFFWAPGSSWFLPVLGAEVDDAHDGSWRCCFVAWLYLIAKSYHMGVDVDGLAYLLYRPMTFCHQTRGQGLLPGAVLPRRCIGRRCLSKGCEAPMIGYVVVYDNGLK
jgi:hypothetical protein